jgi:hypothetical protein
MNMELESTDDDDLDDMNEAHHQPILVWLMMAMALVAMAFLLGTAPEASAHPTLPDTPVQVTQAAPTLAFGG